MNTRRQVWVVTKVINNEPTITVFENEYTAREYYNYIKKSYNNVYIDKYPVFQEFLTEKNFHLEEW